MRWRSQGGAAGPGWVKKGWQRWASASFLADGWRECKIGRPMRPSGVRRLTTPPVLAPLVPWPSDACSRGSPFCAAFECVDSPRPGNAQAGSLHVVGAGVHAQPARALQAPPAHANGGHVPALAAPGLAPPHGNLGKFRGPRRAHFP